MLSLFVGVSKGPEGRWVLLEVSATSLFSPGNNCGSIQLLKKEIQNKVEKHARLMQFQMWSKNESWFKGKIRKV